MILSNDRIRKMLCDTKTAASERLAITPLLDEEQQVALGGCSVDVRLGQRFSVPRRTKLDRLDHLALDHLATVERYKDDYHVLIGDYFVLHPRQFILGETLEWIHLPGNCAAYVIGRSSWGRDGLVIATATGVHPRFSGILTLEISNLGEIPLRLYPGLTIAQLFIHTVDDSISSTIPNFTGSTEPASADAAGSDKDRIRALAKKRGYDL